MSCKYPTIRYMTSTACLRVRTLDRPPVLQSLIFESPFDLNVRFLDCGRKQWAANGYCTFIWHICLNYAGWWRFNCLIRFVVPIIFVSCSMVYFDLMCDRLLSDKHPGRWHVTCGFITLLPVSLCNTRRVAQLWNGSVWLWSGPSMLGVVDNESC